MDRGREIRKSKELAFSGTEISFAKMNDDQIRIRMLEGILEATEKRLLEYIETEQELRRQLKKMQDEKKSKGDEAR